MSTPESKAPPPTPTAWAGPGILPAHLLAARAAKVRDHHLAAPHGAIGTVAGAIGGHTDYRAVQPMLGQDAGDVGMVMLDADF